MNISPPPPMLAGTRLLAYVVVDSAVSYSGRSTLLVDGHPLGKVPCLAITQQTQQAVLLLFCDEQWNPIGIVECASLHDAKRRAEREYSGLSNKWNAVTVSEQEAEQYIGEKSKGHRCSFCGRTPDKVNQLFSKHGANICDGCVGEFHQILKDGNS